MNHPPATNPRRPATAGGKRAGAAPARTLELGILPQLLGYELRLAQRAVFADFAGTVGSETSPGLFGVLVIINANPGLKQTELATVVGLDRSSMVPVINKLEARKLVVRKASPIDRRSNGLFLTRTGSALLARLTQKVLEHEARVAKQLTAHERATLMSLLERMNRMREQVFPVHE